MQGFCEKFHKVSEIDSPGKEHVVGAFPHFFFVFLDRFSAVFEAFGRLPVSPVARLRVSKASDTQKLKENIAVKCCPISVWVAENEFEPTSCVHMVSGSVSSEPTDSFTENPFFDVSDAFLLL